MQKAGGGALVTLDFDNQQAWPVTTGWALPSRPCSR